MNVLNTSIFTFKVLPSFLFFSLNLVSLFIFDDVQTSLSYLATPRTFAHSTEKQGLAPLPLALVQQSSPVL